MSPIQPASNNNNKFTIVVNSNAGDGQPTAYEVTRGETVANLLSELGYNSRDVTVRIAGRNATAAQELKPDDLVTITPNKQAGA